MPASSPLPFPDDLAPAFPHPSHCEAIRENSSIHPKHNASVDQASLDWHGQRVGNRRYSLADEIPAKRPRSAHSNGSIVTNDHRPRQIVRLLVGSKLMKFRTVKCLKKFNHVWKDCDFSHARNLRRDPSMNLYCPHLCQHFSYNQEVLAQCKAGHSCHFCHSKEEMNFHPLRYKTVQCRTVGGKEACPREFCPYWHSKDDKSMITTGMEKAILVIFNFLSPDRVFWNEDGSAAAYATNWPSASDVISFLNAPENDTIRDWCRIVYERVHYVKDFENPLGSTEDWGQNSFHSMQAFIEQRYSQLLNFIFQSTPGAQPPNQSEMVPSRLPPPPLPAIWAPAVESSSSPATLDALERGPASLTPNPMGTTLDMGEQSLRGSILIPPMPIIDDPVADRRSSEMMMIPFEFEGMRRFGHFDGPPGSNVPSRRSSMCPLMQSRKSSVCSYSPTMFHPAVGNNTLPIPGSQIDGYGRSRRSSMSSIRAGGHHFMDLGMGPIHPLEDNPFNRNFYQDNNTRRSSLTSMLPPMIPTQVIDFPSAPSVTPMDTPMRAMQGFTLNGTQGIEQDFSRALTRTSQQPLSHGSVQEGT